MSRNTATFKASEEELEAILTWIDERLQQSTLSERECNKVGVALEEAVVNVVRYAYGDAIGFLEISCEIKEKEISFVLKDQGIPFNPLSHEAKPIATETIEEVSPGGFGILILRSTMDAVHYKREGSYNILTLTRLLPN